MNALWSISQFNHRLLTYIFAPFLRQKLNKEYSIIIIIKKNMILTVFSYVSELIFCCQVLSLNTRPLVELPREICNSMRNVQMALQIECHRLSVVCARYTHTAAAHRLCFVCTITINCRHIIELGECHNQSSSRIEDRKCEFAWLTPTFLAKEK